MEYWNITYTEEVNLLIIPGETIRGDFKDKFGLSESSFIISQSGIKYVVVVDDSLFIFSFVLTFVRGCNYNVLVLFCLPNTSNIKLQIVDSVLVSKSINCFYSI